MDKNPLNQQSGDQPKSLKIQTSELNTQANAKMSMPEDRSERRQEVNQDKQSKKNKQIFFVCRLCKKQFPDGIHYRSMNRFDYEICEDCFYTETQKKSDSKITDHQFISIKSKEEWQAIDFRPIIRLFLDPNPFNSKTPSEEPPITHHDILRQGQQTPFSKQMSQWKKEYQRKITNSIEDWINEFQLTKKKDIPS